MKDRIKGKTILGIFPHPDDEMAVSGLIQKARKRNSEVHLICATRGEAGRNGDRGEIRIREFEESCTMHGVKSRFILNLPDGQSADWDEEKAVGQLLSIYEALFPDLIVTFDSDGFTGHPDHVKLTELVRKSVSFFNYKTDLAYVTRFSPRQLNRLLWFVPGKKRQQLSARFSGSRTNARLKLTPRELAGKIRIIRNYRSQFPDEKGRYFKLPLFLLLYFARFECYFVLSENMTPVEPLPELCKTTGYNK